MEAAKRADSFISYRPLPANYALIQRYGIEEFARRETARMELLGYLLGRYDDGRSKGFYCTSCQLLPLDDLKAALVEAEMATRKSTDIREKSKLIRAAINRLADTMGVDLKLRK